MAIKRYQIFALIFLLPMPAAFAAADCLDKTCVDVFTSDNQLIITAQKGAAKPTPKPLPKPSMKPTIRPKPVVTKKAIAKPIAKPAAASLSDKLVKLLPVGDINFQPEVDPLVNLPVYFWTQTPTRFTALVPILDVVVYVNLTPTFTWSFGDGGLFVTTLQGAPYPIGGVTHTYKSSKDYSVNLKVTWTGTWSVNGVTTPISGNAITQSISRTISVAKAPTRFTK